jgi:uncharacterized protein YdhG (YjbR/CyaY superfamily)
MEIQFWIYSSTIEPSLHPVPNAMSKPTTVDQYIEAQPKKVQTVLNRIRKLAKKAAPDAKELISYQMPALKGHGILIYYAAWSEHIGLYPPIKGDPEIELEIEPYSGPKGNLQFPLNQPIAYDLIERIVKLRVQQDADKKSAAKIKRS